MDDYDYLKDLPEVEKLDGRKAILLLGTDCHIEEGAIEKEEKRVGITPTQASALKKWLQNAGIVLDFYFVQGAGIRAGFPDGDYLDVGGHFVFEYQLSTLSAPNVVHALKEPCAYETLIPGPFIRIGALHSGAFYRTSGLATLLRKKNVCAIFDGSNIGGYSYKISNRFEIPIRSSMSVFAGEIAADYIGDNISNNGKSSKIVISGGGVVGVSAVNQLLNKYKKFCKEILIIDSNSEKCMQLKHKYENNSNVKIINRDKIVIEDLTGASGLVLGVFIKGKHAPKVISTHDIKNLNDHSVIVDVSIDEKGGISIPGMDVNKLRPEDIVYRVKKEIEKFNKNIAYIADSHMPRKKPKEASEAHGRAILPYLATLLYLSARNGGAQQAVTYIINQKESKDVNDYYKALIYDLKNGLAYRRPDPIYLRKSVMGEVLNEVGKFLKDEGTPYEVE